MPHEVYTIGHSNHSLAHFVLLLRQHGITAVADVRSSPYSRRHPHFSRHNLAPALHASAEIAYVFLGQQLGARPDDDECYDADGRVDFERLGESLSFRNGLRRVLKGREEYRIVLMCAEHDPIQCHRGILIAPRLRAEAGEILHIGPDGGIESHAEAEARLLQTLDIPRLALFTDPAEQLALAYREQARRIAWRRLESAAPSED